MNFDLRGGYAVTGATGYFESEIVAEKSVDGITLALGNELAGEGSALSNEAACAVSFTYGTFYSLGTAVKSMAGDGDVNLALAGILTLEYAPPSVLWSVADENEFQANITGGGFEFVNTLNAEFGLEINSSQTWGLAFENEFVAGEEVENTLYAGPWADWGPVRLYINYVLGIADGLAHSIEGGLSAGL